LEGVDVDPLQFTRRHDVLDLSPSQKSDRDIDSEKDRSALYLIYRMQHRERVWRVCRVWNHLTSPSEATG
jgi:hypothetical protein